ncbi:MAG: tetratricopeptide repeat protein, partial [Bacteroidota bacterium]|nr:tetratricopeptide repeat protein [Bacteroidota bacterium]MDX5430742.1 tetratricopeptide repeat protein [Bacteroidota bacterium]MDX5469489.1 tetratricopeptide repeat protein [Bacteroidota bacterium]
MTRLGDCYYISNDPAQRSAAIDAYAYVTSKEGANSDYAWYQIGMIYGLQGKAEEKIVTMKRIPALYPSSEYVDDALYQIALVDLQRQSYQEALRGFSFLLEEYPNGIYAKSSYLNRGLVKYNLKMNEEALKDFKMVVENYKKDMQTDEAIGFITTILNEEGRGNELIDYLKNVANQTITVSYEDSTLFNSAYKHYQAQNCEKAIMDFGHYLERFKNGYFITQASFYRAECLYAKNRYEDAISGYQTVVDKKYAEFYERSLRRLSAIYLWKNQQESVIPYLIALEKVASQKDNLLYAQTNLMYAYLALNQLDDAKGYAEKVLANDKAQKSEKRDAHIIMGRVLILAEKWDEAKTHLSLVEKDKENKNAKGAEAKYYLCYITYKKGNLKELPNQVYDLDEKYANQIYWVAKGYNLLAESYLDQKDLFNARAVLNSLVDNYPNQEDGIVEESKRLLERALDIENMAPQE